MKRIFVTGMSGVGKSAIAVGLAARGFRSVDTDNELSQWVNTRTGQPAPIPQPGEPWGDVQYLWDEVRMTSLLEVQEGEALFVCGGAPNQGMFHPLFDHIVLVSVPRDVMLERLATRSTNPFGKHPNEVARILADVEEYEPMLRRLAGHEIDGSRPLDVVLDELVSLVLA